jgi:hypothetical protein
MHQAEHADHPRERPGWENREVSDVRTDALADRYGSVRPARRRAVILASGLVGVIALAWVAWAAWSQSTPEVQSSLRSFEVLDTHTVKARVTVQPSSSSVRASCLLRAYAVDKSVVGERNFPVTDTEGRTTLEVEFRTEREATSVVLVGCTAPGQSRPR